MIKIASPRRMGEVALLSLRQCLLFNQYLEKASTGAKSRGAGAAIFSDLEFCRTGSKHLKDAH